MSLKKKILLALVSVFLIIVLLVGTLMSILLVSLVSEGLVLENYLSAFPRIAEDKDSELKAQNASYLADYAVQGKMAVLLFNEYDEMGKMERLEAVKEQLKFVSVSLIDKEGNIIGTTDQALRKVLTQEENEILLKRKGTMLHWGEEEMALLPDRKDTVVECRALLNDNSESLVLEYDYSSMSEIGNQYGTWQSILERMLSGLEGYALLVGSGEDEFTVYPADDISEENYKALENWFRRMLDKEKPIVFSHANGDTVNSFSAAVIDDRICFVAIRYYAKEDLNICIAVPLANFMTSSIITATILGIFLIFSLILFYLYAKRKNADLPLAGDRKSIRKAARMRTLPGFITVVIVLSCFYTMLVMLLSMGNTAHNSETQKIAIAYEASYRDDIAERFEKEFPDKYLMRANAIARLLSHDSGFRTREELQMLCDINDAEYLMLYDKNGKEIFASNAYTGFRISPDKEQDSNVYYSLIQGYPYVVTQPVKDDLSGKKLLTAASLITDAEGLPDGFILVAADAKKLADVIDKDSIESVVNDFATQENQLIALVDNETGFFTAHTDKNMIGTNASFVLSESVLGRQFKGVVSYDRREAYMVGSLMEGFDLIIVSFNEVKELFVALIIEVLMSVILILGLFFYPMISSISCAAPASGKKKLSVHWHLENALRYGIRPRYVFAFGYLIFFDILFLYCVAAGSSGKWPEMGFVIERNWSKGVHLFSLWMSLFTAAWALTLVFIARVILAETDKYLSTKTRTIFRLIDSLILYVAVIWLLVEIFGMYGVNTTALVASAGVVSIAVGMGARDLVTDVMAGLFMIFEGSIHVGDVVAIDKWQGTVTDMGIRTTEIANESQDVMIIPNSRIHEVVNKSRMKTVCNFDLEIPRSIDIEDVQKEVDSFISLANQAIPDIHKSLRMGGITEVSGSGYKVRLNFNCDERIRERVDGQIRDLFDAEIKKKEESADAEGTDENQ